MKPHVFYKINNYYVYLNKISHSVGFFDASASDYSFHDEQLFQKYRNKSIIRGDLITPDLHIEDIIPKQDYLFFSNNKDYSYILFIPVESRGSLSFRRIDEDRIIDIAKAQAKSIIMSFKFAQRQKLLHRLLLTKADLQESLNAFTKYCFFDKFAFWVFNPYSKHFCCISSSDPMPKEYVNASDESSLFNFMESLQDHESREPHRNCINSQYVEGMHTLNRLRLDFGKEGIGVLDFISRHNSFLLRADTRSIVKHYVESKYLEEKQSSLVALHQIEEHFSKYHPGLIKSFLYGLTTIICNQLNFQACSIFEKKNNSLNLVAVTDFHQKGKPKNKVAYDFNKETFTGSVFKSEEGFLCSYDIANDPKNSHTYDEATEGPGKAWIAYTLRIKDVKWGVLRVKNKYKQGNKNQLINFTPNDFVVLKSVCTHLSNIFASERDYNDLQWEYKDVNRRRRVLTKELDALTNFYNVFLHEIRTPISTLGSSPLRLLKLLDIEPFTADIKKEIGLKVNDIYIMGERLAFITNTYYFEELVQSRNPEKLSVLKDIIFPVLNISRQFIKKQYNVNIILKPTSLEGYSVWGDRMLLNLVFNTVISNAGKYSDEGGKPIEIYGEYDRKFEHFFICVSNYGLPIYENERKRIFKNRERGKAVLDEKIGGTGIGLHLATEIMKRQRGAIILASLRDPVTFKLKIQMSKKR